jgi:hypothetical protein
MSLQRFYILTGIVVLTLFNFSCDKNKTGSKQNEVKVEVSRFEQDLFSISLYHLKDSIPFLQSKYPRFFPLFTNRIINIGDAEQANFSENLTAFVSDFTIYNLSKTVEVKFADISPLENELSEIFSNYKILFPGKNIPQIITCISGFNQSIVVADSTLVISLDKYLGTDNEFYRLLDPPIPQYIQKNMYPAKIPSDVAYSFIITEYPYNDSKDNLLSQMIFEGRAMFVAKKLLPGCADTLFWGYTSGQLKFCNNNEKQMWTFLVENKYLFNSDKFLITKYIEPAPFTKEFSSESPGRAAVWLGYRIVESFMKNNKDISFRQLMDEADYLKILNMSRYNP